MATLNKGIAVDSSVKFTDRRENPSLSGVRIGLFSVAMATIGERGEH